MFRNMPLQARFAVMLIVIFFISLPLVGASAYYVLRKNIDEDVFDKAKFFLDSMESVRQHFGKVVRPAVEEYMEGRFDARFMSTSYAARGVSNRLKEKFPEYTFRHISMNPRNPLNFANGFEQGVIDFFRKNRKITETKGFIERGRDEFFYIAKPVVSDGSCMHCHSRPKIAPREVVAVYGATAAFGWRPDEVVAALIVYVPTRLAKAHAVKALLTFMVLYVVVFVVILLMIDRAIVNGIIKPIKDLTATAETLSKEHSSKDPPYF